MPTSIFNVKFAILWCDCLIYEIIHAAPKYGNNTKGGEEDLIVIWNSTMKGFYIKALPYSTIFHVSSIKRYEMIL